MLDHPTLWMMCGVFGLLAVAFVVGQVLKRQPEGTVQQAVVQKFNHRVRVWWLMWVILAVTFPLGRIATVALFFLISFWALREFITMTPTRRGDHRALFWSFFLFTPLQYVLIAIGRGFTEPTGWTGRTVDFLGLKGLDFYGLYSIMIPVYASAFIPARIALSGDHKRFLERSAKILAGLLICVYSLSYAPALLDLELMRWDGKAWQPWRGNAGLLFYLLVVVQLADVLQYSWDLLVGKHVIAEHVHATRTWEGFLAGTLSTTVVGLVLWKVTPFTLLGSACMATVVSILGFAGSLTMSAIKRDRGVTDYGTLVQGHPGVLDRIDSLCFAAPVFFHLTRYFCSLQPGL